MTQQIVRPEQNPSIAPWLTLGLITAGMAGVYFWSQNAQAKEKKPSAPSLPDHAIELDSLSIPGVHWVTDDETDRPLVHVKRGTTYTALTPDIQQSQEQPNYVVSPDGFAQIENFSVEPFPGGAIAATFDFVPKKAGKGTIDVIAGEVFWRLNLFAT